MITYEKFVEQYPFNSENVTIGVEIELFLKSRTNGRILPMAEKIINAEKQAGDEYFSYEYCPCQLEWKTAPELINNFRTELFQKSAETRRRLKKYEVEGLIVPCGPANMPMGVYPDPRYIAKRVLFTDEQHEAANRVLATHFHFGMPDKDIALIVYNKLVDLFEWLCILGNRSGGERRRLYSIINPNYIPKKFKNWRQFYFDAIRNGYAENPKDNWGWLRMTRYGTIEFRMFDAIANMDNVYDTGVCLYNIINRIIKQAQAEKICRA